jgi:hypothetical protein
MQAEIWPMLGDVDSWRRMAECPAPIAENLRALATEINERASNALSEIADARVATFAMKALREVVDTESFLAWLRDEAYEPAWKQFVLKLNREAGTLPGPGEELGAQHKAPIKTVCNRAVRVFEEIGEPQKQAA